MILSPFCERVSIRSPHRSKGRHVPATAPRTKRGFQSAPLTEARGDPATSHCSTRWWTFQSAPLTEARGDFQATGTRFSSDVSIRSPHRSKGRPLLYGLVGHAYRVSIRSPHRSKGRQRLLRGGLRMIVVSIRSPHRSKGRQRVNRMVRISKAVSIRSPHRSKGRRKPGGVAAAW